MQQNEERRHGLQRERRECQAEEHELEQDQAIRNVRDAIHNRQQAQAQLNQTGTGGPIERQT